MEAVFPLGLRRGRRRRVKEEKESVKLRTFWHIVPRRESTIRGRGPPAQKKEEEGRGPAGRCFCSLISELPKGGGWGESHEMPAKKKRNKKQRRMTSPTLLLREEVGIFAKKKDEIPSQHHRQKGRKASLLAYPSARERGGEKREGNSRRARSDNFLSLLG